MKPLASAIVITSLTACAATMTAPDVPQAVAVPAGHRPAMTLKGVGLLTYECRAKAGTAGAYEWVFAGPDATLQDRSGRTVGKYYGGPTWEHNEGGKITGKQLAIAPAGAGSIPLQLVQTTPATGAGPFNGVTYIQRVNTMGGVAPTSPCDASTMSTKQTVKYSADYVFYKQ
ncbi:MAG: DUF3455 domain-containing protein [Pseudomonadota bacterium]